MIIFFLIIIWASISLSVMIQDIYSGPERSVSTSPSQQLNTPYINFPESNGYYILLIMEYTVYAWIALFFVALIFYFKSTLKILYRGIMSFLGVLIVMGIAYIITVILSKINTFPSSSPLQGISFSTQAVAGTLPIIAGIIVLSALFIYIISKNFYIPFFDKNERMSETLSKMIRELKFGNDVRGSIMKAYYDLSNLLKKYGIIESDYLTPREFENISIQKVHLETKPFETLIRLFEEARYSAHNMNETQREEAISALERIKQLLGE